MSNPTAIEVRQALVHIRYGIAACEVAITEDPGCVDPDRTMTPFEDLGGEVHRLLASLQLAAEPEPPATPVDGDGLREAVRSAIPVIDDLFAFLAPVIEGADVSVLAIHEASKPLADAREALAAAVSGAATPVVEEAPERVAVNVEVLLGDTAVEAFARHTWPGSQVKVEWDDLAADDRRAEMDMVRDGLKAALDAALADLQESDSGGGGERG